MTLVAETPHLIGRSARAQGQGERGPLACSSRSQYEFFVRGLIAATVVGALCGLIGVYIVLRKMSYIGHGLSHAIFGGAVVAYVIVAQLLRRREPLGLSLGAADQRR